MPIDTGKNRGGHQGGMRVDTRVLPVCDCLNQPFNMQI
jgi:hypothetical protein